MVKDTERVILEFYSKTKRHMKIFSGPCRHHLVKAFRLPAGETASWNSSVRRQSWRQKSLCRFGFCVFLVMKTYTKALKSTWFLTLTISEVHLFFFGFVAGKLGD